VARRAAAVEQLAREKRRLCKLQVRSQMRGSSALSAGCALG
jgi:hypothetical protein